MKFIISGGWSYGNLGDEVIAKVTMGLMKKTFPNCSQIYTSYDPEDFKKHHNINAIESVHSILEKQNIQDTTLIDNIISNPEKYGVSRYADMMDQDSIFIMSGGGILMEDGPHSLLREL